jgi:hypothetical protein
MDSLRINKLLKEQKAGNVNKFTTLCINPDGIIIVWIFVFRFHGYAANTFEKSKIRGSHKPQPLVLSLCFEAQEFTISSLMILANKII